MIIQDRSRPKAAEDGLNDEVAPAIVLIAEDEEESKLIDKVFGSKVLTGDGLIANVEGQVRLSDGYAEHYIFLKPRGSEL